MAARTLRRCSGSTCARYGSATARHLGWARPAAPPLHLAQLDYSAPPAHARQRRQRGSGLTRRGSSGGVHSGSTVGVRSGGTVGCTHLAAWLAWLPAADFQIDYRLITHSTATPGALATRLTPLCAPLLPGPGATCRAPASPTGGGRSHGSHGWLLWRRARHRRPDGPWVWAPPGWPAFMQRSLRRSRRHPPSW